MPAREALYRGCLRTVRSARLRAPLRLNLVWFLNALLLEAIIVKRLLASLLLIGALIGLFGAQMAAARSVPTAASAPRAMSMDAECLALMAQQVRGRQTE